MSTLVSRVPLSVLDLVPISSGSSSREAIANTIDLARQAEAQGYSRYWLAEHHLNPGVAGSSPHIVAALVGVATSTIRVGTAATILGNYSPVKVAEDSGTLAAALGDRFDLGLGRSGAAPVAPVLPAETHDRWVDGLLIPAARQLDYAGPRFTLSGRLLGRTPGDGDDFERRVDEILAFFAGSYESEEGIAATVTPAEGANVQVWLHGSTASVSARLAGQRGLPFGANYHVAGSFVLDAVAEYRAHFRPSDRLAAPHVIVSVDVVVGADDETARELAAGYASWVLSIRSGNGAILYPTPEEADEHVFTPEQRLAVADRLRTRVVGSPATVVAQLERLQRATGADELLITTITHAHADRVNSYRLLAEEWLTR
jgi:alkanesulfonate monooxygenase SsuD/methylene tetrahydromethanopterin reductase-like flavin-dependent oxidoreductase (luciferase family)